MYFNLLVGLEIEFLLVYFPLMIVEVSVNHGRVVMVCLGYTFDNVYFISEIIVVHWNV